MKLHGKRVDLPLLTAEMNAAAIPVTALGIFADDLFTYEADGSQVDLPSEAQPVVDAHVPPPLVYDYVRTAEVSSRFITTDGAFKEIYRLTTTPRTIYRATLSMEAVDAASIDVKDSEARLVYKNTGSALVPVGATIPLGTAQDAAASAWAIAAQIQGLDLVIGVRGAAGRTIDWVLQGQVVIFAPGGVQA